MPSGRPAIAMTTMPVTMPVTMSKKMPKSMQRKSFHVADLSISPALRRLSRGGERLPIEPRVLDLILLLVRERDRIVSKQDLFDEVWSGVVVTTGALDRAIHVARRVLGDRGDRQTFIRTIRGKGFQFVAPVREEFAAPEAIAPALFGRDEILAELTGLLGTHRRSLRVIAIDGEAGIGKTSLAKRLAELASERGHGIRSGRCTPTLGSPPFWPWIQLISGDGGRRNGPAHPGATSPIEIASLVGAPELGALDYRVDQTRFWLFDAVERHLQTLLDSPQVWILDDLQWADEASLHLLAHLAGAELAHPILLVTTFRGDGLEADHVLRRTLTSCGIRTPVDSIRLGGLDSAALRQLSLHLTGQDPSAGALEALAKRTGGNPFLATESLLRAQPPSIPAPPAPTNGSASASSSPFSSLVRSRLDLLEDDVQQLLSIASVIGRRFDAERIGVVAGQPVEHVERRLGEAVRAGIILEDEDDSRRYEFRHDLLRESLYASLPPDARVSLHRRVGEAIETLYGSRLDARIAELAFHFHESANPAGDEKAIDYSIRAGESACAQFGFEQASHHFENALSALEREQAKTLRREARVLLALADSARRTGDRPRAQASLHRIADLARRLDEPTLLIQAALAMQLALTPIEVSSAEVRDIALLRDALAEVPAENRIVRARLLARLSTAFYWRPIHALPARRDIDQPSLDRDELEAFGWSPAIGRDLAEEAVATAREAADPTTLAYASSARYIALSRTQRVDERRALAREIARLAMASDDWELRLVSQGLLLTELAQAGEAEAAIDAVDSMQRISEALRHPLSRWHASLGQVLARMIRGELVDAEQIATEAYQRTRGDINLAVEDCFIQQRFSIYRFLGRLGELEETTRQGAARYGRMSNFVLMLAMIDLDRGRRDDARRHLDWACANDFEEIGEHMLSLFSLMLAAEICVAVGTRDQAHAIYDRLLPHQGRCATINFVTFDGPVDRTLGLLADRMGESGAAIQHLEQAIEQMRSMRSLAWLAQCLADTAEIGLRSQPNAEHEEFKAWARECEDLRKRHGFVRS